MVDSNPVMMGADTLLASFKSFNSTGQCESVAAVNHRVAAADFH